LIHVVPVHFNGPAIIKSKVKIKGGVDDFAQSGFNRRNRFVPKDGLEASQPLNCAISVEVRQALEFNACLSNSLLNEVIQFITNNALHPFWEISGYLLNKQTPFLRFASKVIFGSIQDVKGLLHLVSLASGHNYQHAD